MRPGTDLVFPLPVAAGRLDPHVDNSFSLSTGGPVLVNVYNSTAYTAFQKAFDADLNSTSPTDVGGENIGYLYSSGTVNSGSFTFNLPKANGTTFYMVYINRSLTSSLEIASDSSLIWALPSCG